MREPTTTDDNKLDPRVTEAIEQTTEFLADALTDDQLDQLLAISEGLDDEFDRMLVLKRAICMVIAFRHLYRRRCNRLF